MQNRRRISLNAVRVFAIAAGTGSLAAAGTELRVTAGAVSHQIKRLEEELGTVLFRRANNTISLTEAGARLFQEVAPAIALIERSAASLYRDENAIVVQATTSLALRCLIPSLDRFRALCPQVRVRVETYSARHKTADPGADVQIRYFRNGEADEGWKVLARDVRRPVASPNLLKTVTNSSAATIAGLPAIQCARGNWDWSLWCAAANIRLTDLSFGNEFDTDDAAIHCCVAGLGVMLAPTILTSRETQSGTLLPVPGCKPIETGTYRYQRRSETRAVRQFCSWLETEMRSAE